MNIKNRLETRVPLVFLNNEKQYLDSDVAQLVTNDKVITEFELSIIS